MSTPDPVAIALARQMPWTVAEPESIWLASGHINPKSSFVDCLIYALPHEVTDGGVLFVYIGALSSSREDIEPSMITKAHELVLTYAADPLTAYLDRDQDAIDRALKQW